MIKALLSVLTLLTGPLVYGQELYFSANGKPVKEINVSIDTTKDTRTTVLLSYQGTQADITGTVKLLKTGTVDDLSFITFPDFAYTFTKSGEVGVVLIFKKGTTLKNIQNKSIMLGLTSNTLNAVKPENALLILRLNGTEPPDKAKFNTDDFNVTLLTGANFKFFDGPQVKDFAGLLNVQAFNVAGKWGLNLGVSNINFSDLYSGFTDGINDAVLPRRNILLDPKAGFVDGAKYEAIAYKRTLTQSTNSWSYFLQPSFRIHENETSLLSLLVHLELLSQTTTSTITEQVSDIDTFALKLPDQRSLILRSSRDPGPERKFRTNFTHGYFGGGLSWNIRQPDKFNIMLHATTGFTTDSFGVREKIIFNDLAAPRILPAVEQKGSWFYFLRSVFTERYTKLNGTIGFDLRGSNNYRPQVALYFGVRIDFNKFFGS